MFSSFILICLLAGACIATTSIITYEVMSWVWNKLPHLHMDRRLRVLWLAAPIFFIHIVNIWLYAAVYFCIENFTQLGHLTGDVSEAALSFPSFIDRLYFSSSTYASLGLGDITPAKNLRMIAGAEVLNGLVTIGWTISFTFLAMENFWSSKA